MMQTITKLAVVLIAVIFCLAGVTLAEPIDLSSWTRFNLDFPGFQPSGNWVLSNSDTTVTQTVNTDPTMFLNNIEQTSYGMQGNWRVSNTTDNDFIGFVFGFQDSCHFYIMDWKKANQDESGYGFAQEGFSIKRISAPSVESLSVDDFWLSSGTEYCEILDSYFDANSGWQTNVTYEFKLEFQPYFFNVKVSLNDSILWDTSVSDSAYTYGQFGFYNFSQEMVVYSGFKDTLLFNYLPGDANMATGGWPPAVIGSDVTYLVTYFRGVVTNPACMLSGFYAAADVNGDCRVIGSDVTRLVNYFRSQGIIEPCPDYPPTWVIPNDCPEIAPVGWPNCEGAIISEK